MPPARDPRTTQGALSNYMNPVDEPVDHALGRSRGGWTTKIHALVDARCAPLVVTLTAGQAGDNPQLPPLLLRHTQRRCSRISACSPIRLTPTTQPVSTCANTASRIPFPNVSIRSLAAKPRDHTADAHPVSTPPSTKHRNTVERGFNRLKHWRGIATRYDKLNRPGMSGDSDPWEGWSHVREYVEEVPAGVEGAGGADGRRDPR